MVQIKECFAIEKFACSKNYAKSFSNFVLYISNMISPFKTIIDNDTQKFRIIDPLQYSVIQGRIIDINFPSSSLPSFLYLFPTSQFFSGGGGLLSTSFPTSLLPHISTSPLQCCCWMMNT